MTELFERELSDRLHAHPLPDEIAGLASSSIQRGQRIRRRRMAAVAAVVVLVLMVPVTAWTWLRSLDSNAPPVGPARSASATQSSGAKSVILDPVYRQKGEPPSLAIVRDKMILHASGPAVEMPADQFGTVAEYREQFVWLTRAGNEVRFNVSSQPVQRLSRATGVTGVEPGPGGSVMVRSKSGPVFLSLDAAIVSPDVALLRTDRMAATATALWVESKGQVTRIDASDLRGRLSSAVPHPEWRTVVFGDPQADLVVVTDREDCQVVVNGSTSTPVWRTCDWTISAFSADGRFAAGQYAGRSVVELSTGRLLLAVDIEDNPVAEQMYVDNEGRISMLIGHPSVGFAVATCDLAANCTISRNGLTRQAFVYPNR